MCLLLLGQSLERCPSSPHAQQLPTGFSDLFLAASFSSLALSFSIRFFHRSRFKLLLVGFCSSPSTTGGCSSPGTGCSTRNFLRARRCRLFPMIKITPLEKDGVQPLPIGGSRTKTDRGTYWQVLQFKDGCRKFWLNFALESHLHE